MMKQWSEVLKDSPEIFRDATIVSLFKRAAAYDPQKTALVTEDGALTFHELDEQSSRVASALRSSGAKCGEIIGIRTGRCKEAILTFLGAWKIGCACLYLDEGCPSYRNQECLDECEVKHIATREFVKQAVCTQTFSQDENLGKLSPENLAVVVYTSGSTGRPKGVLITQRNLAASISNFGELGFCSTDRYCCFANLMFVAAVYDMAAVFSIGACLYLIPEKIRRDIRAIARYYEENRITVTFLPPLMAMKYQEIDENSPLKILLSGSEPVRGLSPRPYRIINVYASSESSAVVCHYTIREERHWYPIGHPVKNVQIYVVDEDGRPVRPGETGELWIAGPQISQGYLKNPEAMKRHFASNPFCQEKFYDQVFMTADLVSVEEDGELEYHGRKDNMVKIRGFRVELTGVEKWMLQYPGIREACCVTFMDSGGTNLLFGYYLSWEEIDHENLRSFLGEHLPYYMVPLGLVRCEEFPRTLSGKTDRKGFLPPPEINDHKLAAKKYR